MSGYAHVRAPHSSLHAPMTNAILRAQREAYVRMFLAHEITETRAAELLHCSVRHVYRLAAILQEHRSLAYQSHPAWNRTTDAIEGRIIRLFQENPERNNQHLADLLAEREGIAKNRNLIRRVLARRGLRHSAAVEPPVFTRFEHREIGAVVYQDTSPHRWVRGGQEWQCIAAEDDHSRKLLAARLVRHDGAWQNLQLLRRVVTVFGLPQEFFTDRKTHFFGQYRTKNAALSSDRRAGDDVQIGRALSELGVYLGFSRPHHPESKGKIEKLFGFMQERIPKDLEGARTLPEANRFLGTWTRWYNTRHVHEEIGCVPEMRWRDARKEGRTAFVPLPETVDLDAVFAFRDTRVVRKDNSFRYLGETDHLAGVGGRYIGKTVELRVIPPTRIQIFFARERVCTLPFRGRFPQTLD